jgi:S1-C subfamily serine protease
VIRETGLVLTIGYLITEAETVWIARYDGRVIPGHALAIDQETGFGLVQALDRLDCPALEIGRSADARIGDSVVVAAGGGTKAVNASIVVKQEFAGYWEYLLEEAIFTSPAHPFWGGAGAIDASGRLLGVGSLHVEQLTVQGGPRDINMIVPIDLLPPILDDLLTRGRVNKPARPWLGIYCAESAGEIVVAALAERGPAASAGLRRGDILASVRGAEIADLADFYRKVWRCGEAGVEIPIEIIRDGRALAVAAGRTSVCDLVDELAQQRVSEAVEVVDRHDERAFPSDHIVAIVLREPARRIGVQGEIASASRGALIEDRQSVDHRAARDSRVPRRGDRAALIARSVA